MFFTVQKKSIESSVLAVDRHLYSCWKHLHTILIFT